MTCENFSNKSQQVSTPWNSNLVTRLPATVLISPPRVDPVPARPHPSHKGQATPPARAALPRTGSALTVPTPCPRCGARHWAAHCRFREATCFACGKRGHITAVCCNKSRSFRNPRRYPTASPHQSPVRHIHQFSATTTAPLCVDVTVNGTQLQMEVDTGASASIISNLLYQTIWPMTSRPLLPSSILRHTYSGKEIKVLGSITVDVNYRGQCRRLPLLVVATDGPALFGRDWLKFPLTGSNCITLS